MFSINSLSLSNSYVFPVMILVKHVLYVGETLLFIFQYSNLNFASKSNWGSWILIAVFSLFMVIWSRIPGLKVPLIMLFCASVYIYFKFYFVSFLFLYIFLVWLGYISITFTLLYPFKIIFCALLSLRSDFFFFLIGYLPVFNSQIHICILQVIVLTTSSHLPSKTLKCSCFSISSHYILFFCQLLGFPQII